MLISLVENRDTVYPVDFTLNQNYPNPFNPGTVINWPLAIDSHVGLSVFNLISEEVTQLVSEKMNPLFHELNLPLYDYSVQKLAENADNCLNNDT